MGVTRMEGMYWAHFMQTGKVEDYLFYKGVETCRNVMEKYGENKIESVDCSNRNDIIGITDRGIR